MFLKLVDFRLTSAFYSLTGSEKQKYIYLDFQNVFDKVPHPKAFKILSCHGIEGKVLWWTEN